MRKFERTLKFSWRIWKRKWVINWFFSLIFCKNSNLNSLQKRKMNWIEMKSLRSVGYFIKFIFTALLPWQKFIFQYWACLCEFPQCFLFIGLLSWSNFWFSTEKRRREFKIHKYDYYFICKFALDYQANYMWGALFMP